MNNIFATTVIQNSITKWLTNRYDCIEVSQGQIPPAVDDYQNNNNDDNAIFLARNQIKYEQILIDVDTDTEIEVAQNIKKCIVMFKNIIRKHLKKHNIKIREVLYVSEWPTIFIDEKLTREGKISVCVWMDVYCEKFKWENAK